MANVKISQLNDGSPAQAGDEIPITRGASNFKISAGDIADLLTGNLTASKPVFTNSDSELVSTGTMPINQGGTGATTASNARTNLGLGSIATQDASSIAITGGSIAGITDLAVADGGTGASTASAARVNLLPSYASNATKVLKVNAGATDVEWGEISSGGVTSVTAGTGLNGGTITSTGTIALATAYGDTVNPYAAKTANYVLAAPNGSSGTPTFRALVAADIPTLNQNTTGNAATATALQTARTINGTSFDGTSNITVADSTKLPLAGGTMTGAISFVAGQTWPTFNQNTTGTASNVTGTVAIANGGTGATTESGARTALGVPASPTGTNAQLLANDGSGGFSNVTVGSGLSLSSGTLSATGSGFGTVTSVDVSGGTTGLTTSGGPVTNSGTITLSGTLAVTNGGTGLTSAATNGQLLIGNGTGFTLSTLTAGSGISVTNSSGAITITNTGGGGGGGGTNLDGGLPDSSYLAVDPIDGGTP